MSLISFLVVVVVLLLVVVGKTSFDGPKHQQQSMILVPMNAPGITILRAMAVFGHEHDHAEIIFDNVKVPVDNVRWFKTP